MNILTSEGAIAGADFLDLFAGTGRVSLAALDAGAASVLAVESDARSYAALVKLLAPYGERARAVRGDVRRVVPRLAASGARFGVVFADPPYGIGWGGELPLLIERNIAIICAGGLFVFERSSREDAAVISVPRDDRCYGETVLSLYRA